MKMYIGSLVIFLTLVCRATTEEGHLQWLLMSRLQLSRASFMSVLCYPNMIEPSSEYVIFLGVFQHFMCMVIG